MTPELDMALRLAAFVFAVIAYAAAMWRLYHGRSR